MKTLLIILTLLPFISVPTYKYITHEDRLIDSLQERQISFEDLKIHYDGDPKAKATDPIVYYLQEWTIDTLKRSFPPFLKLHKGNVYKTAIRADALPNK